MKIRYLDHWIRLLLVLIFIAEQALSFEDTQMLPKGVRRAKTSLISTQISQKTNAKGAQIPLAASLSRVVTFADLAGSQTGLRARSIPAFLKSAGGNIQDSAGNFAADIGMDVLAYGVQLNYGLSDRWSIGFGLPIYNVHTQMSVGFQLSDTSRQLLNKLTKPEYSQHEAARQVLTRLNQSREEIDFKLSSYGYKNLPTQRSSTEVGDIILGAKYLAFQSSFMNLALTTGAVLPTGKVDDPSDKTDFPVGDGQYDLYETITMDWKIAPELTLSTYGKYTYQHNDKRKIRFETASNPFSNIEQKVDFKLGDKYEAGTSLAYKFPFGLEMMGGLNTVNKFKDDYKNSDKDFTDDVESYYEKNTNKHEYNGELALSFSTVEYYKQKQFMIPMCIQVGYKKHLESVNSPVSDQASLDLSMYF